VKTGIFIRCFWYYTFGDDKNKSKSFKVWCGDLRDIRYSKNLTEKVQIEVVKRDPSLLNYIDKPSLAVKQAAKK
jgi:hypothetical protein